jgi:hypothetical protein
MHSDDEDFLDTQGIRIYNDRNQEDIAYVSDKLFSGIE